MRRSDGGEVPVAFSAEIISTFCEAVAGATACGGAATEAVGCDPAERRSASWPAEATSVDGRWPLAGALVAAGLDRAFADGFANVAGGAAGLAFSSVEALLDSG